MTDKDRIILHKIMNYVQEIIGYVDNMDYKQFVGDRKTIAACAFCIGQIGELAKDISAETQELNPEIAWKSIRGMRNKIVHDYENVDLGVLWGTIRESLPELVRQINQLLGEKRT
ncbi:uncharacterized protein with HEPN domain [Desulfitobacterium sp. LBE]|uniref:HepT-like ribonuclease domain-containing protein n=1 Tax=Desulfitobacterium sp. LBE TaxID=884086 RepID=UPI0011996441|nr:HepT-like ribonuclease domain-containing protein [Desulfitobacterium sp. LBE]TWH60263.1 uncharacterized protein with HEPN domain [Desulfitobacterium sp. LBE]